MLRQHTLLVGVRIIVSLFLIFDLYIERSTSFTMLITIPTAATESSSYVLGNHVMSKGNIGENVPSNRHILRQHENNEVETLRTWNTLVNDCDKKCQE